MNGNSSRGCFFVSDQVAQNSEVGFGKFHFDMTQNKEISELSILLLSYRKFSVADLKSIICCLI